ncbi:MAG TPA: SDR family NAD(P)-dependent oxidoreductase [Terriglobales bacterium]|jgi:NAD(P)-dependent dehydrogenase (short-subunit alcohol dehydrogenase family)
MSTQFENSSVLVAGGTGGLGRSVTLAFLEAGAKVAVTFQRSDEFDGLKNAGARFAGLIEGHQLDVTNEAGTRELVSRIISKHGRLDVLVNCVGGYAGGTSLWELDPKVFEQMLALNLRSGFLLSRATVPLMLRQGTGVVINVASQAAVNHAAGAAAYAASKAAAVAMIDSLAADLKGTGVRANSILPSIIDTPANRRAMPNADFSKWPKPEEIARVILFLCSDEAKLIHGAAIPVYGTS